MKLMILCAEDLRLVKQRFNRQGERFRRNGVSELAGQNDEQDALEHKKMMF